MKFALHNGERKEAATNLKGALCPVCDAEVIAKCGNIKIHHWAHKSKKKCDHWWDTETQWHRDWKNEFPIDWQEVVHTSKTGEKHIADVKLPKGLVVEFQHSPIKPEEILARNNFYKNIIWIVDGTRRKNDEKGLMQYIRVGKNSKLINEWGATGKIVFFDFGNPKLTYLTPDLMPLGDYMFRKFKKIDKKDLVRWIYNDNEGVQMELGLE